MSVFSVEAFLPRRILDRVTDARVAEPGRIEAASRRRSRRAHLTRDGRLNVLAADHPGRRVTAAPGAPMAMADRHDYLGRIVPILVGGAVDGVMATMDIIEDLLLLDDLVRAAGGPSFLDEKLLIASMNRGGLAGVVWELDDPLTGADAETIARFALDGGKLLLRLCDDDVGSLRTLEACASAISRLNAHGLPTFLEPLPARRKDGKLEIVKEAGALARIVGVASALGNSSRHLWLKLPYCEGYAEVARATTLPILLLGGESAGDPRPLLGHIADALAAGSAVRGTLVGRNVLYPGDGRDPLTVARAVDGIVHGGWDAARAADSLDAAGPDDALDGLRRWFA